LKKLMMLAALLAMVLVAAAPAFGQVAQGIGVGEAESGDVEPEVAVANKGDSVNQCVALLQQANSGNVQNAQGVNQYGVTESGDIELAGSNITISPEAAQECEQVIEQAAAAGKGGEAKAGKAEAKAGEAKAGKAEAKAGKAEAKAAPAEAKAGKAEAKAAPAEAKAGKAEAKAKELPKTGGGAGSASLLALGAGALLVGGGLIARRFTR
jgi:LPXTG-motif cell wall-anchored protein